MKNKEVLRTYKVERIGLFGSYVTSNNDLDSDIDLLVEFQEKEKTFKNYTGAYLFLKDLFKKEINFLTPESLSPYIGPHILKQVEYVSIGN